MTVFRPSWPDGALFSECGLYRYALWRTITPLGPQRTVLYVGLNPSDADAAKDDNTVRVWTGFAHRNSFTRFLVANLYGLISTDPKGLKSAADPVGSLNDWYTTELFQHADAVVCCWGAAGAGARAESVLRELPAWQQDPLAIGVTKHGEPRHPLRTAYRKFRPLSELRGHA